MLHFDSDSVTMSVTNNFFKSASAEEWTKVLELYNQVLKLKASTIQKPGGSKNLLDLDKWFQTELSQAIQERKERYITHEELAKLMKWKLSRGKFRPRLTEMVQTNSSDLVEKSSRQAFKKLPNVGAAIKELIVLKAVGPATASAVLAAGAPEHAPFMADESMLAIPGQSPLAYTEAAYKRYNAEVQDCVKRLKKEDPSGDWTPHKVELALWTHYMACKLDPSLLASKTGPSKKRKSTGDGEGETPKKK